MFDKILINNNHSPLCIGKWEIVSREEIMAEQLGIIIDKKRGEIIQQVCKLCGYLRIERYHI